jgi:TetR/AcrR family transcriptional regulator, transcriptional repressor for nem operon
MAPPPYHRGYWYGGANCYGVKNGRLRSIRDETDGAMTEDGERRGDTTRHRLISAAARKFARHPYSTVSLEEILAEAELTKGAMYFHFSSKQALALKIIDDLTEMVRSTITELLDRKMSGLETLIEFVFVRAVQDIQFDVSRAGVRLLDALEDATPLPSTLLKSRAELVTALIEKAAAEGDVVDQQNLADIAKMVVALWEGIRRTSDLDQPEDYLNDFKTAWMLALTSFTNPDRINYFTKFMERRHVLAVRKVSAEALSFDVDVTASSRTDA